MTTGSSPEQPIRVLLIDDDPDDYLLTRDLLADLPGEPFTLDWVSDFDSGLNAMVGSGYDVYLLDYRLGVHDGLELLHELRRRNLIVPVIVLTGQGEYTTDRAAMQAGAADYLEKGRIDATLLERAIRHALLQKRYEAELERAVRERTQELNQLNEDLRREVAVRARVETALREMDQRKDEFLATLAHELRNPLAPITNALEIMRLTESSPTAIEKARAMMERQVRQMVRLINDLLDVSRIATDKFNLETETVDLRSVVDAAIEISRPLIEKGDLTLTVQMPNEPVWVTGDRVRLAQVFSNLLNNAAKYTEAGGSVSLVMRKQRAQVRVDVLDTGIGIPPEVLPKVFDLFTQVDRSLNRSQGGLGIGLALVKRLVEMHGGAVTVHSNGRGHGTEFSITLPTTTH